MWPPSRAAERAVLQAEIWDTPALLRPLHRRLLATGFLAAERLCAVLISAIWVSACGKLPVWRPAPESYSSANSPRSFATATTRSNSRCALSRSPASTWASASHSVQARNAPSIGCFSLGDLAGVVPQHKAVAHHVPFDRMRWCRGRGVVGSGRKPTAGNIRCWHRAASSHRIRRTHSPRRRSPLSQTSR